LTVLTSNGYIVKYLPDHPRAYSNGTVYEHILVAEKMLGRPILPEEEVHHIDHCKTNNEEYNLMVFESEASHAAFHNGYEAELNPDGSYRCYKYDKDGNKRYFPKERYSKNYCKVCGKPIRKGSKYCWDCYKEKRKETKKPYEPKVDTRKVEWPAKDELETLILTNNMTQLGKMYGVADNTVRSWCKIYGLPYKKNEIEELRKNLILS